MVSIHDRVERPFVPYSVSLIRGAGKYVSQELVQKSENYKHAGKYESLYVVKELPDGKRVVADGPVGFHNKTETVDNMLLTGAPLEWDEVVKMRAATGTRILDEDIRYINKGILAEHQHIQESFEESEEMSRNWEDEADIVERKRSDLGFYNDNDVLPAYAENEIGTTDTPSEIRERASKFLSDAEELRDECTRKLYERVHELDVTDTRKFGDKVAGRSPRGGPAQLELLKLETREALGPEYDEYHTQKISDRIHETGERNIQRIRSEKAESMSIDNIFGIDVSRKAVAPVPEKEIQKEADLHVYDDKPAADNKKSRHYDDVADGAGDDELSVDDYDGGRFGG